MQNLTMSDLIQLIGIMASLFTSIIAISISVKTLKQNNKMIEESCRPVVSAYTQSINPGVPMLYLVLKNFGNSTAYMEAFESNFDFSKCYRFDVPRNYIEDFGRCVIAPGQSRTCLLDYSKLPSSVYISLKYKSAAKTYHEEFEVDLKAAVDMPSSKYATKDKELLGISYSLQEMLLKGL